jgi:hypothetical protein
VSRDFFCEDQTDRTIELKIPGKIFPSNISNSFSHTQKKGELKKWVQELYTKDRNSPPIGTHNIVERNGCPNKVLKAKINRDSYIHNHIDLVGMHMAKIDQKNAYIEDNHLINELTNKSDYVKSRKMFVKENNNEFKELVSANVSGKTLGHEKTKSASVSFVGTGPGEGRGSGNNSSILYRKFGLNRKFMFTTDVRLVNEELPLLSDQPVPASYGGMIFGKIVAKGSFDENVGIVNGARPVINRNSNEKLRTSFYKAIDRFESSLKGHKEFVSTEFYPAIKFSEVGPELMSKTNLRKVK